MKTRSIQGAEELTDDVIIRYDAAGMPHIHAKCQRDAYFGQGYAVAQDRRWQLDLYLRTAAGRLAECFGKRSLAGDRFQRTLGLARLAEKRLLQLTPEVRARIDAYAEGVNFYTSTNPTPQEFALLQVEPEPWSALNAMTIAELRSVTNASWRADLTLLQVLAKCGKERASTLFSNVKMMNDAEDSLRSFTCEGDSLADIMALCEDSEDAVRLLGLQHTDSGTNTWVVPGTQSETGKPLLANDLHMGYVAPNPNFMVHLEAPGLNVRGVCFPGMPGVVSGHNDHIAWGAATFMADSQDVFVERLDNSTNRYRFANDWRPLEEFREAIRVRDADTEELIVRSTHHGPILKQRGDRGLALRWERLDQPPGDPTMHALNTACDWSTFRNALRDYAGPSNDFTFADRKGNIGVQTAGRVPIRSAGNGAIPVNGSSGQYEWIAYIDFDEFPSSYNPACGHIVRSNQDHVPTSGPAFTYRWHPPYRAMRVRTLLSAATGRHNVESFAKVQYDRYSQFCAFLAAEVVREVHIMPVDSQESDAVALLEEWDGNLVPKSPAAAIAKELSALIREELVTRILGKRLSFAYQKNWPSCSVAVEAMLRNQAAEWLPPQIKSYSALYNHVLAKAVRNLTKAFGSSQVSSWTWGSLHKAAFPHPLERIGVAGESYRTPQAEVGSDGECVFSSRSVGDYISAQQNVMMDPVAGGSAVFGASVRMIWDLSDWNNSSMLLNLGQSGDPSSPHYVDQLELWTSGAVQKLPFSRASVEAAAESTLRISPRSADTAQEE